MYLGMVVGWLSPIIEENIDFISEYIDNFVEQNDGGGEQENEEENEDNLKE